jgi:hypothetical protein
MRALEELPPKEANRWIPTEDRFPEEEKEVLAFNKRTQKWQIASLVNYYDGWCWNEDRSD